MKERDISPPESVRSSSEAHLACSSVGAWGKVAVLRNQPLMSV